MDKQRWLVVVQGGWGYIMDAYPDELKSYRRELGDALRSEHASRGAAFNALRLLVAPHASVSRTEP